jgi:hypothetical protein
MFGTFFIKHLPMLLVFGWNLHGSYPLLRFVCSCCPLLCKANFPNNTMEFLPISRFSALFSCFVLELEDSHEGVFLWFMFWLDLYTLFSNDIVFGPVYARVKLIEKREAKDCSILPQSSNIKPLFSLLIF